MKALRSGDFLKRLLLRRGSPPPTSMAVDVDVPFFVFVSVTEDESLRGLLLLCGVTEVVCLRYVNVSLCKKMREKVTR